MPTNIPSFPDQPIGGGIGEVTAWGRPDLVVAAPGGIVSTTPATSIYSAGNTITLVAQQDINVMAGANYSVAIQYGLILFTVGKAVSAEKPNQETGIKLHAASGNVRVEAQTNAVKLTADKSVEVASTNGMVRITAPNYILLTAGGAALDIQAGSITLKGTGMIEFKAAMKNLTGPGSASQSLELKTPGTLEDCAPSAQQAAAAQAMTVNLD